MQKTQETEVRSLDWEDPLEWIVSGEPKNGERKGNQSMNIWELD